jgi:hypothetical protein
MEEILQTATKEEVFRKEEISRSLTILKIYYEMQKYP